MNHLDIMDALGYAQKKYWQYTHRGIPGGHGLRGS